MHPNSYLSQNCKFGFLHVDDFYDVALCIFYKFFCK